MLCLLCVIFKVGVTLSGNDYLKNHTIKQMMRQG